MYFDGNIDGNKDEKSLGGDDMWQLCAAMTNRVRRRFELVVYLKNRYANSKFVNLCHGQLKDLYNPKKVNLSKYV